MSQARVSTWHLCDFRVLGTSKLPAHLYFSPPPPPPPPHTFPRGPAGGDQNRRATLNALILSWPLGRGSRTGSRSPYRCLDDWSAVLSGRGNPRALWSRSIGAMPGRRRRRLAGIVLALARSSGLALWSDTMTDSTGRLGLTIVTCPLAVKPANDVSLPLHYPWDFSPRSLQSTWLTPNINHTYQQRFIMCRAVAANTKHLYNICTMLDKRLADVVLMLYIFCVCWGAGKSTSWQQLLVGYFCIAARIITVDVLLLFTSNS